MARLYSLVKALMADFQKGHSGRPLDPARRRAILDAARIVLLRDGFAQGSMDAVAAEAGVGKQTIYRHFVSKDGLVTALVEAMCEAPQHVATEAWTLCDSVRSLLNALVTGLTSDESISLYRALVAEADRAPRLAELFWNSGPRRVRTVLADILAPSLGQPTAEIRAAQLIQLSLGDAFQERLLNLAQPSPARYAAQIDAAIEALLGRLSRPAEGSIGAS